MRTSAIKTSFSASDIRAIASRIISCTTMNPLPTISCGREGGKKIDYLSRDIDDWKITFVETGANSNIGERLKAVEPYLQGEEIFLANYGDGLSDVPLPTILETFRRSNAVASMLLVQPTASFDIVNSSSEGMVTEIRPLTHTDIWINGGFFVMRNEIFRYIQPGEELVREPFQRLIEKRSLLAYRYNGFWECMDTFKDKQRLDELNHGAAPWKVWNHVREGKLEPVGKDIGRQMIPLKIDVGNNRDLTDSLPRLSFRRYRNWLRRHDSSVRGTISQ